MADKPEKKPEEKPAQGQPEEGAEKKGKAKFAGKPKPEKKEEKRLRAREILRVAETDLDSTRPVKRALRDISGISFMMANAITNSLNLQDRKLNTLTEDEVKTVEDAIANPEKHDIPGWMINRRSEWETGQRRHLVASKLELAVKMDINRLRKLKAYKGVRHSLGLPVRGQRTRSSFRQRGITVGVKRGAAKQAATAAAAEKKKEEKK